MSRSRDIDVEGACRCGRHYYIRDRSSCGNRTVQYEYRSLPPFPPSSSSSSTTTTIGGPSSSCRRTSPSQPPRLSASSIVYRCIRRHRNYYSPNCPRLRNYHHIRYRYRYRSCPRSHRRRCTTHRECHPRRRWRSIPTICLPIIRTTTDRSSRGLPDRGPIPRHRRRRCRRCTCRSRNCRRRRRR